MKDYLNFFTKNKRIVSFGLSLTFFSSFGQTFLISLYVPALIKEFGLTNSSFGMVYGGVTILSSITLAYVGKHIDRRSLRNYTLTAVLLLLISCLVIAFSFNIIVVLIGLWGLRFTGQSWFSHISQASMSKMFERSRGKALSLSVMGYPLGEAIFPVIIAFLIGSIGWRKSMIVNASFIGLILLPFIFFALNKKEFKENPPGNSEEKEKDDFSRRKLFKDFSFYILSFNATILPALVTGLFFYQVQLANEKGWSTDWLAACFIAYAGGRTLSSFLSGKLIDNHSAVNLLPFHLIPFLLGLLALTFFRHPFVAPFYLLLTGISMGINSPLKSSLLAEVYGTKYLGSIRSLLSMIAVIGTAVSPVVFGLLLDRGIGFDFIAGLSATLVLLVILVNFSVNQSLGYQKSSAVMS